MSLLHPKNRAALVEAALGERPFDLLIENIRLLNVFTREMYPARVGIYDGFIAHVEPVTGNTASEPMDAKEVWDGEDGILAPGYIDAHMHIESTMMTPRNFTATALPWGTTTVVTDPHGSANVLGKRAVKYMLEASEELPMRHYVLAPSCVPALPGLENSGASFDADDIDELLEHDRVLGLAEVMDYVGVIRNNPRMRSILEKALEKGAFIQGHAPKMNSRELSAYLCAGPASCHESHQSSEAREKIRNGMFVDARESSMSANVRSLVPGLAGLGTIPDNFTLCTDNVEPSDLLRRGHMNHVVHTAIESGMDPVNAIVCATYNVAKEVGIRGVGAIAPGYVADMQILPNLHSKRPSAVFYKGNLVAADGWLVGEMPAREFEEEQLNTFHLDEVTESDLRLSAPVDSGEHKARVIRYTAEESSLTECIIESIPVQAGFADISNDDELCYVAVLNRHPQHNTRSIGLVRNIGITRGAVASTVGPDCHNLIVVFRDIASALQAISAVRQSKGGIACADTGELKALLPLPVLGLMSDRPAKELAPEIESVKSAMRELGMCDRRNPLLRTASLSLAVVPELKITDLGLVDVQAAKSVPVWVE